MTTLGDEYKPVKVETLDIVGYKGDGKFLILNPVKSFGRELPEAKTDLMSVLPLCLRAQVVNNQVVNFGGEVATLHDIDGI